MAASGPPAPPPPGEPRPTPEPPPSSDAPPLPAAEGIPRPPGSPPLLAPLPPPDRPRRPPHRWAPTLGVLALILVLVFGGYATAASLSEAEGAAVEVVPGVLVHPLAGWRVAERISDGARGVRLTRGDGSLDVIAVTFEGDATDLFRAYVRDSLEPQASQLRVASQLDPVTLGSGLAGVRGYYVGTFGDRATSIEGEVTAVVASSGIGLVFDGWAPQGQYGFVSDNVHVMTGSTEVA